jgi:hypothetical protein
MSLDWENLQQRIQKRSDGTIANPVQLDGLPPNADIKQIGAKLNQLADKARTGGQYEEIGSLYGLRCWSKPKCLKKGRGYSGKPLFGTGRGQYQIHLQRYHGKDETGGYELP